MTLVYYFYTGLWQVHSFVSLSKENTFNHAPIQHKYRKKILSESFMINKIGVKSSMTEKNYTTQKLRY